MSYWRSFRSLRPQNVTPLTHLDALLGGEVARIGSRGQATHPALCTWITCNRSSTRLHKILSFASLALRSAFTSLFQMDLNHGQELWQNETNMFAPTLRTSMHSSNAAFDGELLECRLLIPPSSAVRLARSRIPFASASFTHSVVFRLSPPSPARARARSHASYPPSSFLCSSVRSPVRSFVRSFAIVPSSAFPPSLRPSFAIAPSPLRLLPPLGPSLSHLQGESAPQKTEWNEGGSEGARDRWTC